MYNITVDKLTVQIQGKGQSLPMVPKIVGGHHQHQSLPRLLDRQQMDFEPRKFSCLQDKILMLQPQCRREP